MTDYYPLIARAVANLPQKTEAARRALYERARSALIAELRGRSESEAARECGFLEEAIGKAERKAKDDLDNAVGRPSANVRPDITELPEKKQDKVETESNSRATRNRDTSSAATLNDSVHAVTASQIRAFLTSKLNLLDEKNSIEAILTHLQHQSVSRWDAALVGSQDAVALQTWNLFNLALSRRGISKSDTNVEATVLTFSYPPENLPHLRLRLRLSVEKTRYGEHHQVYELRVYRTDELVDGEALFLLTVHADEMKEVGFDGGARLVGRMRLYVASPGIYEPARVFHADDLITACREGRIQEVLGLLDKGVDVNYRQTGGWSALHYAAHSGHEDIARALSAKGANVNGKLESGWTALMLAIRNGHSGISRILIDSGADIGVTTKDGLTALALAASYDQREMVQVLLDHGGDVNTKIKHHGTLLGWASHKGETRTVEFLLQNGVDINGHDESDSTELMDACHHGNARLARILIERGADAKHCNKHGVTALHLACNQTGIAIWFVQAQAYVDVVQLLLDSGVDVNSADRGGTTALMRACEQNNADIVRMLLDGGADMRLKDEDGKTARDYAKENDRHDILEVLRQRNRGSWKLW